MPLDAAQSEELLSFVREGKGFVAAHVALTAFESWPEFLDLIGARFDGHPISGPGTIINESPDFPATKHFAPSFAFNDEFYQPKDHLAREDRRAAAARSVERAGQSGSAPERRLSAGVGEDLRQGPRVLRLVRACSETWDMRDVQQMYFEAMRWALGLTEADPKPHPMRGSATAPGRGRGGR